MLRISQNPLFVLEKSSCLLLLFPFHILFDTCNAKMTIPPRTARKERPSAAPNKPYFPAGSPLPCSKQVRHITGLDFINTIWNNFDVNKPHRFDFCKNRKRNQTRNSKITQTFYCTKQSKRPCW